MLSETGCFKGDSGSITVKIVHGFAFECGVL